MRKRGHTVDEFLYLIEYLTHHHVIGEGHEVTIRILDPHPNSSPNFNKAKDQYIEGYQGGGEFRKLLDAIDIGKLEHVRTDFCELELSRQ